MAEYSILQMLHVNYSSVKLLESVLNRTYVFLRYVLSPTYPVVDGQ